MVSPQSDVTWLDQISPEKIVDLWLPLIEMYA